MCTEMSHVHRMFGNIITLSPPFTHFLFPRKTRVNGKLHKQNYTINFYSKLCKQNHSKHSHSIQFSNLLSFSQEQETQKSVNGEQSV